MSTKNNKKKETKFPHFRKYFKSNHPTLIVGEQKTKNVASGNIEKLYIMKGTGDT